MLFEDYKANLKSDLPVEMLYNNFKQNNKGFTAKAKNFP